MIAQLMSPNSSLIFLTVESMYHSISCVLMFSPYPHTSSNSYFEENNIGKAGATLLAAALCANTSLREVDLQGIPFSI